MEHIFNLDDIEPYNLIFKLPVKNQNNHFLYYYKILYSDIFVHYKYLLFCIHSQYDIYDKLQKLELNILNSLNQHVQKEIQLQLFNEIDKIVKMMERLKHSQQLFLKISGVWENDTSIGIVYKIYYGTSTVKLSKIIC